MKGEITEKESFSVKEIHFRKKLTSLMFVLPSIILILILMIYPLIYSLKLCFHSYNLSIPGGPEFIGIQNFLDIFSDERFWHSLKITTILVAAVVSIEFFFGLGIAELLNQKFRGWGIVGAAICIPMMVAPIVAAQIWRILYHPSCGPINYFLRISRLWVEKIPWVSHPLTALLSIIIVDVWQWTPFAAIILLAGLTSLPQPIFESARIDGASSWKTFRFVTLPLLKPVIAIVLLLRIIDAFRLFDQIYVLTVGGPGISTETASFYIYVVGFRYFDMGYAAALSYIIIIILSVGVAFFLKSLTATT